MFKQYAIEYAQKYKWNVFPCNGKVPLTPNGYKDASSDPEVITKLFAAHPNANIGVVTGKVSSFFALDIDIKKNAGGENSLIELEKSNSPLPLTLRSSTWSGGTHYFFKYPESGMGCKAGIRPGIDIRADGGYVVAPPSVINGKSYSWINNAEIVDAPDWLLNITMNKEAVDLSGDDIDISSGQRNSTLISIAGKMRSAGCSVDQIEMHLLEMNKNRCKPPLTKREVLTIVKSSGKYSAKVTPVGSTFNCNVVADTILKEKALAFCVDINYEWNGTVYTETDISYIRKLVQDKLGQSATTFKVVEVIGSMKRKAYMAPNKLNWSPLLNLQNGMFDIDTFEIIPHDPQYCSTIQLPVEYKPGTPCPLWIQTLDGIFGDKEAADKKQCIEVLQEFFGLCLTKEVKYEKSLFMLGEGRNGKSTLLYALENVLGHANYSAVTLEALVKPNYVSELFGKLTNISIETNAKSSIYDAMFKAIVSGDTVAADRKYGHPFKFRPFCKMVFALNNMPQVNDKTDAFYKRLITLRLTRQFADAEQDRALKPKILSELNGIFLWMIEGYHRLKARGYFDPGENIENETNEYRMENNSVLSFVDEKCHLDINGMIPKDNLYEAYRDWCKASGVMSLSKKRFGIQLVKHYNLNKDSRDTRGDRIWEGISLTREITSYGPIY